MTEQVTGAAWRKSSRSGGSGNCVELSVGTVNTAVRDTKSRDGGNLTLPAGAFAAFVSVTKVKQTENG